MDPYAKGPGYTPGIQNGVSGNVNFLMVSHDFGANWSWTALPSDFQAGWLVCDPSDPTTLYGLSSSCLRVSHDQGGSWSGCNAGAGLKGTFTKLLVKDAATLFLLRSGQVPLRSQDGGKTWTELTAAAPLFRCAAVALI